MQVDTAELVYMNFEISSFQYIGLIYTYCNIEATLSNKNILYCFDRLQPSFKFSKRITNYIYKNSVQALKVGDGGNEIKIQID